jgi:hypothetical protein
MDPLLAVAAALIAATAVAHSWLGERYLVSRLLRRPDLPQLFGSDVFARRTIRYAWHLTTIAWLGFAVALVFLSGAVIGIRVGQGLLLTIAGTAFASAGLAVVVTRGRHLSWVVLLTVAVCCALAAR